MYIIIFNSNHIIYDLPWPMSATQDMVIEIGLSKKFNPFVSLAGV